LLFNCAFPFKAATTKVELLQNIRQNEINLNHKRNISKEMKKILFAMLAKKESQRPLVAEIFKMKEYEKLLYRKQFK